MAQAEHSPLLPGRDCNGCTMCCKILGIDALDKPVGKWCEHCDIGAGCKIYDDRPQECRDFFCAYLTWNEVPADWQPSRSKIVLDIDPSGEWLRVHVDPSRPDAWKKEPFYTQIKNWAAGVGYPPPRVMVRVGARAIVILPDSDIDLGVMAADEVIVTEQRPTHLGMVTFHAYKKKKE